ncbi:MAG: lipopolysaccharide assembly protein LapA domain-containing protein [Nocardioides sp.]
MTHEPAAPDSPEATNPEPAPTTPAPATTGPDPLRGSRTSGVWGAVIAMGLLLILLTIFIVQNTQEVKVTYLGWNGTAPLAVSLLVATAAGLLLAAIAGSLRILQLRRRVKRDKR